MSWKWGVHEDAGDTATNGAMVLVPHGRLFHILSVWIELTTSDSAGNRVVHLGVYDSGDSLIMEFMTPAPVRAASGVQRFMFGSGMQMPSTEVMDTDYFTGPLPSPFLLGGGHYLRVIDASSVDNDSDVWKMIVTANSKGAGYTQPAA
jgi:hypothetical protein